MDYDRAGQPLYICYKDGTAIKRSKDKIKTDKESTETPETQNIE